MVHDRGKIKWASLMLPEHVEMLQDFFADEPLKEKPILDEDYVNEMELTVQQAIHAQQKITLNYYQNSSFKSAIGHIIKIDPIARKLTIQEAALQRKVPIENIVAIELLHE
ncbi:YolD-like family protein [Gracilibacillus lacisalsi]|uniref:YolD-like family protein n=1 Tax=Gracilibacillus lacisalsi TaxID=393087 RepID=UPI0003822464|nr:YolD-like family protein [Gracilibacillus lacisalsi]